MTSTANEDVVVAFSKIRGSYDKTYDEIEARYNRRMKEIDDRLERDLTRIELDRLARDVFGGRPCEVTWLL